MLLLRRFTCRQRCAWGHPRGHRQGAGMWLRSVGNPHHGAETGKATRDSCRLRRRRSDGARWLWQDQPRNVPAKDRRSDGTLHRPPRAAPRQRSALRVALCRETGAAQSERGPGNVRRHRPRTTDRALLPPQGVGAPLARRGRPGSCGVMAEPVDHPWSDFVVPLPEQSKQAHDQLFDGFADHATALPRTRLERTGAISGLRKVTIARTLRRLAAIVPDRGHVLVR